MEKEKLNAEETKRRADIATGLELWWDLFAKNVGELGKDGKGIQRSLTSNLSPFQRLRSWNDKLNIAAQKRASEDPDLNVTEARVALMTENGRYRQVLNKLGGDKDIPQGYVRLMGGLNSTLPWNRNFPLTNRLDDVTQYELDEALGYIKKKLEKVSRNLFCLHKTYGLSLLTPLHTGFLFLVHA